VVVADLRDDVRGTVPRDSPAVDDELGHGPMVLAKPVAQHGGAVHGCRRVRGSLTDCVG
jgi:hypothetical protein